MASIRITARVIAKGERAFGPGKADLLERIAAEGSISKAAKAMEMSYSRAWQLVDAMNNSFRKPLVESSTGGKKGGGAVLTRAGEEVLSLFRKMEEKLAADAESFFPEFEKRLR
ncbi:MAG: LysR family transcriptional regulator [Hyphomonadaceae bacterium]|jgi:molybdate transport system regulatory protein|nr:LysR family transcriptional regulator [Hyphomonadaceae bacterium]